METGKRAALSISKKRGFVGDMRRVFIACFTSNELLNLVQVERIYIDLHVFVCGVRCLFMRLAGRVLVKWKIAWPNLIAADKLILLIDNNQDQAQAFRFDFKSGFFH